MMLADDTRENVWTVAWAWDGSACSPGAPLSKFFDLHIKGEGNRLVVAREECVGRRPGQMPGPCRVDAEAAPK
jgi:hypothetical protein